MKIRIILPLFFLVSISIYSQEKEFTDLIFNDKSNFQILKIFKHKIPKRYLVLNQTTKFSDKNFHLTERELSEPEKSDEHSRFLNSYIFRNENLDKLFDEKEKIRLSLLAKNSTPKIIYTISNKNVKIIDNKKVAKKVYFQISEPLFTENENYAFLILDIYNFDKSSVSDDDDGYFLYGYVIFVFQKMNHNDWKIMDKYERIIF